MDSADSSSSSSSSNNNDTKILKVTESILSVCNTILSVSDLTPDEKVQVLRNITENKEAALTSTTTTTSTPSTTSAATATHDDTQSGSGLAPFAGASLRDRILDGMKDINDTLQSRLTESKNERLLVEVTGQNGSPIYCKGSMRNAKRYGDDGIALDFDKTGSSDGFLLSPVGEIEIRVGGVVVHRININDDNLIMGWYDDLYDEENRMENIALHNINRRHLYGPIDCVYRKIGPLPLGWREGHGVGDEMLLTDLLELVADETNDLTPQTLIIDVLDFRKKDITGIMSLI